MTNRPVLRLVILAGEHFGHVRRRVALVVSRERLRIPKPLYFLYFHTREMAFKAFLRFYNVPTLELKDKKGHQLGKLYEDCRDLGLKLGPEDRPVMDA